MNILRVILIVVIFLFMIFILFKGTESGFIPEQKETVKENIPVTCYAKEDIQRVEKVKCGILLQQLGIQIESECDCSDEIEEVENMYKEYIMNLEETCYYDYNSYLSWEY